MIFEEGCQRTPKWDISKFYSWFSSCRYFFSQFLFILLLSKLDCSLLWHAWFFSTVKLFLIESLFISISYICESSNWRPTASISLTTDFNLPVWCIFCIFLNDVFLPPINPVCVLINKAATYECSALVSLAHCATPARSTFLACSKKCVLKGFAH